MKIAKVSRVIVLCILILASLSFPAKAAPLILIGAPCTLVSGAFNQTNNEYNININRNHAGQPDGSLDLGGGNAQPLYGNSYQKCIDFLARAAIAGTVTHYSNDGCGVPFIEIIGSSGVKVQYIHLDMSASNTIPNGSVVQPGQVIGTISNKGCADFKHIHFTVKKDGVEQMYNHWKFVPSGCFPPGGGDWIVFESCSFVGNFTMWDNIKIINNSTLTIEDGSQLNFDFLNRNIIVTEGSKLIVKPTGKIY